MKKHRQRSNVHSRAAQWWALGVVVTLAAIVPGRSSLDRATFAANHSVIQQPGPRAVAVDQAGNLYIADTGNSRVLRLTPGGQISILLDRPFLNQPSGLAVDANGNLFIADTGNNRIWCRTLSGNTTICLAGFVRTPTGLAVDALGNLYIADTGNSRVLRRTPTGSLTRVAGTGLPSFRGEGGLAINASLNSPEDVGVDRVTGNVFIADTLNHRIRMVSAGSDRQVTGKDPEEIITTIVGSGRGFSGDGPQPASTADLNQPSGITLDSTDNLFYIADRLNHRVRLVNFVFNSSVNFFTFVGSSPIPPGNGACSGDRGLAVNAQLNRPNKVAFDSMNGILYIADTDNNRIRKVTLSDGAIMTVEIEGLGQCP